MVGQGQDGEATALPRLVPTLRAGFAEVMGCVSSLGAFSSAPTSAVESLEGVGQPAVPLLDLFDHVGAGFGPHGSAS